MEGLKTLSKRWIDTSASKRVNSTRVAVESLEQEFRNLENARQAIDRDINKVRGKLETLRLELQGLKISGNRWGANQGNGVYAEDILRACRKKSALKWQDKLDQVAASIVYAPLIWWRSKNMRSVPT